MLIMRRDWTLSWVCPSTSETKASFMSVRSPEFTEGTLCSKDTNDMYSEDVDLFSVTSCLFPKKLQCLLFQQLNQVSKLRDRIQGLGEWSPKCLILAQIMKQLELPQYSNSLLDMKNLHKIKPNCQSDWIIFPTPKENSGKESNEY